MATVPSGESGLGGYSSGFSGDEGVRLPGSDAPAAPFGPPGGGQGSGIGLQVAPTVTGAYSYAWSLLGRDFVALFIVGLVYWLVAEGVSVLLSALTHGSGLLTEVYGVVVGGPLTFGLTYAYLDAARGRIPTVNDLWRPFKQNYVNVVLAFFLWEIVLVVGFVLFVIPGIILAIRLAFVPYIVMNEGAGPVQALQASWARTAGYSWTIFGAGLLGVVAILIGLIILVVGVIPATMLVSLAFAALYLAISARKGVVV